MTAALAAGFALSLSADPRHSGRRTPSSCGRGSGRLHVGAGRSPCAASREGVLIFAGVAGFRGRSPPARPGHWRANALGRRLAFPLAYYGLRSLHVARTGDRGARHRRCRHDRACARRWWTVLLFTWANPHVYLRHGGSDRGRRRDLTARSAGPSARAHWSRPASSFCFWAMARGGARAGSFARPSRGACWTGSWAVTKCLGTGGETGDLGLTLALGCVFRSGAGPCPGSSEPTSRAVPRPGNADHRQGWSG